MEKCHYCGQQYDPQVQEHPLRSCVYELYLQVQSFYGAVKELRARVDEVDSRVAEALKRITNTENNIKRIDATIPDKDTPIARGRRAALK